MQGRQLTLSKLTKVKIQNAKGKSTIQNAKLFISKTFNFLPEILTFDL